MFIGRLVVVVVVVVQVKGDNYSSPHHLHSQVGANFLSILIGVGIGEINSGEHISISAPSPKHTLDVVVPLMHFQTSTK